MTGHTGKGSPVCETWLDLELVQLGPYSLSYETSRDGEIVWVHLPGALRLPANEAMGRPRPVNTSRKVGWQTVLDIATRNGWKVSKPKVPRQPPKRGYPGRACC